MSAKILILLAIIGIALVKTAGAADYMYDKSGDGATLLTQWTAEDRADHIAIGPGGEVYVNINQNYKVVKYSPEGEMLAEWDVDGVIETNGIAVGPGGEVYVNINQNYKVVKYSPEGEMLNEWTGEGEMTDMAAGPNGLVYVSFTDGLIQVLEA